MIKIVLPDHPDKHDASRKLWTPDWPVAKKALTDGVFRTEITHNGNQPSNLVPDKCWDIDVYFNVGIFQVRIPQLSREEVDTRDMLMELMIADNGAANDIVGTLLPRDLPGLWEAYLKRREVVR